MARYVNCPEAINCINFGKCNNCATYQRAKDVDKYLGDVVYEKLYDMAKTALFRYNGISLPEIEDVIFNDPATIVFWSDHTKTVVKTQNGEAYDPEKGLAMAISKKVLGNDYGYYETFARHIGRYEKRKKKEAAK
jgi:hypothetical protein